MGDKLDKKTNELSDHDAEKKTCDSGCKSREKSTENSSDCMKNVSENFSKTSSNGNIASLLSAAEKTIKEFYDTITKKITNFVANDLQQLKDLSKDELTKLNSSLSEYKSELEKLSQDKLRRIGETKKQLQTRIITTEEVKSFVKYFDDGIARMKTITENIMNTLRKNEAANNFVKDLQAVITDYGKRMTSAINNLYNALKETAGDLGLSGDKKKFATKMPSTSEMQKIPSMMNKMFKRTGTGSQNLKDSGDTAKRLLLPVSRFREKLPTLNLSKHFNSDTMHGRANVAKATYVGCLLYFLYWKMKKSRS